MSLRRVVGDYTVANPDGVRASGSAINVYGCDPRSLDTPDLLRISRLGFSHICMASPSEAEQDVRWLGLELPESEKIAGIVRNARDAGLRVLLDISPRSMLHQASGGPAHRDPRRFRAKPGNAPSIAGHLADLAASGIDGFRCLDLDSIPVSVWRDIRRSVPNSQLLAWAPSPMRGRGDDLASVGFDFVCISDDMSEGRAAWLDHLSASGNIGDVLVVPDAALREKSSKSLCFAAALGAGLFVPSGSGWDGDERLGDAIRFGEKLPFPARLRWLSGEDDRVLAFLRTNHLIVNSARSAVLVVRKVADETDLDLGSLLIDAHADLNVEAPPDLRSGSVLVAQCRRFGAVETSASRVLDREPRPRVVIEAVEPVTESGRFSVKSIVGRVITVTADIFCEGHGRLAADLLWQAHDEITWHRIPMVQQGNDRWGSTFCPQRVGAHRFLIEAWPDIWGTFIHDLNAKQGAGVDTDVDMVEGALIAASANDHAAGHLAFESEHLQSRGLAEATRRLAKRSYAARSDLTDVRVDRAVAEFGNWYELFPRSITDDPNKPGTFLSVIGRLPEIREMGFDVLYFPPIHPIGTTSRKGRNNSLAAAPGDVGSPYAIGSPAGGHDAVDPGLGTIDDFCRLVAAAKDNGMEIALDFAAQCSPDHPWLQQHRNWFRQRPDGSVKCAENPPKKYQDIVNPEFYGDESFPDVWNEIYNIFLFWIEHGVRIFRVDNPHTKPFPFWEWLIRNLQNGHPDVIFLAEAFTRPKLMYRLAELGFSQSYTYFTWRNTKEELVEFVTSVQSVSRYFRPNLFVNTPDINPHYLQQNGRQGFLVRAVLAATLSGNWGVYSGFELCEMAPLLDHEEYLDSEKYQIRRRDFQQPGNIIPEITRLNRIRKLYPALQSHLGVEFFPATDPNIICYGKLDTLGDGMILMAVNLRPGIQAGANIEAPFWRLGLDDNATATAIDLWTFSRERWAGRLRTVQFQLGDLPFRMWHLSA